VFTLILIFVGILVFLWGMVELSKVEDQEEYRKAMLDKDYSDNRAVHLHNHYPEEGTIKNVIDITEEK